MSVVAPTTILSRNRHYVGVSRWFGKTPPDDKTLIAAFKKYNIAYWEYPILGQMLDWPLTWRADWQRLYLIEMHKPALAASIVTDIMIEQGAVATVLLDATYPTREVFDEAQKELPALHNVTLPILIGFAIAIYFLARYMPEVTQ